MTKAAATNLTDLRKSLKLSQAEFWANLGVTQSGGSRYESGRTMPKPTRMLFDLVYLGTTKNALRRLENLREAAKGAPLKAPPIVLTGGSIHTNPDNPAVQSLPDDAPPTYVSDNPDHPQAG